MMGPHPASACGPGVDDRAWGPRPSKARRPDVSFLRYARTQAVGAHPTPCPAKGEP